MLINYKDDVFSYPFSPTVICYNKKNYLMVPDFFKSISSITVDDLEYIPSIVPEWLPFSMVEIDIKKHSNLTVFNKFLKVKISKTTLYLGRKKYKMGCNTFINFHKVNPLCNGSPRFYTYSYEIDNIKENENICLKDNKGKLFAIYYYHEKINDKYRIHFIPISLFLNILDGGNTKVISLPFKNEIVEKVGKINISMDEMYNYNLRLNLPVDINLMIDGKLEKQEIIKYKNSEERVDYYHLKKYDKYVFSKESIDGLISSMEGNKPIYDKYISII